MHRNCQVEVRPALVWSISHRPRNGRSAKLAACNRSFAALRALAFGEVSFLFDEDLSLALQHTQSAPTPIPPTCMCIVLISAALGPRWHWHGSTVCELPSIQQRLDASEWDLHRDRIVSRGPFVWTGLVRISAKLRPPACRIPIRCVEML